MVKESISLLAAHRPRRLANPNRRGDSLPRRTIRARYTGRIQREQIQRPSPLFFSMNATVRASGSPTSKSAGNAQRMKDKIIKNSPPPAFVERCATIPFQLKHPIDESDALWNPRFSHDFVLHDFVSQSGDLAGRSEFVATLVSQSTNKRQFRFEEFCLVLRELRLIEDPEIDPRCFLRWNRSSP